jgi:hypothetical protein
MKSFVLSIQQEDINFTYCICMVTCYKLESTSFRSSEIQILQQH